MQLGTGVVGLGSELYSANGVVRGTDTTVNANGVFLGVITQAGAAGFGPSVEIRNPAGTGKIIFIDAINLYNTVATVITGYTDATPLTPFAGYCKSCKLGGADGVGALYSDNIVGAASILLGRWYVPANTLLQIPLAFPIEMVAGTAYTLACSSVLGNLTANFYTREFTV
jgi:hypothetical protein